MRCDGLMVIKLKIP